MWPASSRPASTTRSEPFFPTSTRTAGSTYTWRTTRIRTGCTRTWPGPVAARADPAGLGFRFEERAGSAGAADPNAGMGVANADADGDGLADLFVSNSRGQQHAVLNGLPPGRNGSTFANGRPGFAAAFGPSFTGWGASWADLDLDGDPDLVLANGSIPVTNLARDAQPIQVLENRAAQGAPRRFIAAATTGLPRVVGRGLAVADYDNDGRLDVALNSVGGRLILLRGTAADGNWLEVSLAGFHPGARVTAMLARRAAPRPRGAGRQQLPLVGGSTRPFRAGQGGDGERVDRALPERP